MVLWWPSEQTEGRHDEDDEERDVLARLRAADWELVDPDEPRIMAATFARAYDRIRIRFTPR